MSIPTGYYYSKEHEWVKIIDGKAYIGITDFAQAELGDIVFVELPEEGTSLTTDEAFGSVESVKTVSELYAPVSGTVVSVNVELEDSPELVNSSSYEQGWMIVVELDNEDELNELMSAEEYAAFVNQE